MDVVKCLPTTCHGTKSKPSDPHHHPQPHQPHHRILYALTMSLAFLLVVILVVAVCPQRPTVQSVPAPTATDHHHRGKWRRRLPTALIIGAKKSGTRALLEFTRAHPHVRAYAQEAHFFDRNYHKGLEWYRKKMPVSLLAEVGDEAAATRETSGSHVILEKTPSYFITAQTPRRVYHMSSHTRLIVVVRDPVTRAISDYAQAKVKRPDLPSFENMAIAPADDDYEEDGEGDGHAGQGRVNQEWGVIRIGMYARHLRRWLRYFHRSSFHFVSGERLISNPSEELRKIEQFLGLEPFITKDHFYFNSTKGFPCLKDPIGHRNQCLGESKGRQHPHVHHEVIQKLRDFYAPRNKRFYELTGQDFGWA